MKTLTVRDLAFLKRNAQNVYPRVSRYITLKAQKEELETKIKNLEEEIQAIETGSRLITGGFNSIDLINRVQGASNGFSYEPNLDTLRKNEDGTWSIIVEKLPEVPEEVEVSEETTNE